MSGRISVGFVHKTSIFSRIKIGRSSSILLMSFSLLMQWLLSFFSVDSRNGLFDPFPPMFALTKELDWMILFRLLALVLPRAFAFNLRQLPRFLQAFLQSHESVVIWFSRSWSTSPAWSCAWRRFCLLPAACLQYPSGLNSWSCCGTYHPRSSNSKSAKARKSSPLTLCEIAGYIASPALLVFGISPCFISNCFGFTGLLTPGGRFELFNFESVCLKSIIFEVSNEFAFAGRSLSKLPSSIGFKRSLKFVGINVVCFLRLFHIRLGYWIFGNVCFGIVFFKELDDPVDNLHFVGLVKLVEGVPPDLVVFLRVVHLVKQVLLWSKRDIIVVSVRDQVF